MFMVRQTREPDLALMVELAKAEPPKALENINRCTSFPPSC